ncbi:flavin monoamine oxidase family protein [Bosea thiooxidans]|nr:NAD(P)/FAD-dependent oxidoreductase [Bosea sp. (in: a-proteobacteria)]
MSDFDVVIIGAGSAGIAACRSLLAAGRKVVVLEARSRAGGRAWTVDGPGGSIIDLGAAWMHSAEQNPMVPLAEKAGSGISRRNADDWPVRLRHNSLDDNQIADFVDNQARYLARVDRAAQSTDEDRPIADLLDPDSVWTPLLAAMATWNTGANPTEVSTTARRYRSYTGTNWRPEMGYGRVLERLADGLPVVFEARVRQVDWSGKAIKVVTGDRTFTAASIIVTVPPSVLADGGIDFRPALPAAKARAIAGLPLGVNNKIYFSLNGTIAGLPDDTHLVGSIKTSATGSYQIRPMGRPLLEMFLGADIAKALETDGEAAMAVFAREEIDGLFGAGTCPELRPVASSRWLSDPYSRGGYSYARPGRADERLALAEPIDGRLFFAGEATSRNWHSTVHGAWGSGESAAAAISGTAQPR